MALNLDAKAPPMAVMLSEWPRAAWGLSTLPFAWPELMQAPRGDGRPVLTLPGLVNSDLSNIVMRRYLDALGYRALPWELGRNFGPRAIGREGERLFERIAAIHDETGEKVTLIGVSLGGIMARVAAHRHPELVREVITVSSPFAGLPTATNVWRVFELVCGQRADDPAVRAWLEEAATPLPVPATAIWSRNDGLVNGMCCHEAEQGDARSIEVDSSHLWVQMKPEVLRAIADTLGRGAQAS
ncbi:alpha/beta fold hydrolase [Sphingomonas koreensis]|jgi:triacylglycerol lipase|uniref:alpha/beta fold hydrolase n=1 Tax=Sphingomonas koreensis TaxID=93064 RepID=UPI00082E02A8|nr:alpha/beta fold hydrolase [Sphingomonas koreensis]PJI88051.1 alpha/beta hydrolase family protein [Sphingomonas koreensis]